LYNLCNFKFTSGSETEIQPFIKICTIYATLNFLKEVKFVLYSIIIPLKGLESIVEKHCCLFPDLTINHCGQTTLLHTIQKDQKTYLNGEISLEAGVECDARYE
jgi:hypothetical protein